jgi:hypothetical protein
MGIRSELELIRQQVSGMRPDKCCEETTITAGGITEPCCSPVCAWQKLELLIATAMAIAAVEEKQNQDLLDWDDIDLEDE